MILTKKLLESQLIIAKIKRFYHIFSPLNNAITNNLIITKQYNAHFKFIIRIYGLIITSLANTCSDQHAFTNWNPIPLDVNPYEIMAGRNFRHLRPSFDNSTESWTSWHANWKNVKAYEPSMKYHKMLLEYPRS